MSGAVCLFCSAQYTDVAELQNHMTLVHDFNYQALKTRLSLNFYQQVKLINFVRRQMYLNQCVNCNKKFAEKEELFGHMNVEDHLRPPEDKAEWDQPQYFFSTYENDTLLYSLEDDENSRSEEVGVPVIAQDIGLKESILFEEDCRKALMPKANTKKSKSSGTKS